MSRIALVGGTAPEVDKHLDRIRRGGHDVERHARLDRAAMLRWRTSPPEAFVLDLDRAPSEMSALAVWLRQQKATRSVPIIFAGGDPTKTQRIRKLLPDATYAEWRCIRAGLRHAIDHPPADPLVPGTMDGYAGAPLTKKLGIRAGTSLALAGAPAGFERKLGPLPDEVRVAKQLRGRPDVVLLFVKSETDLKRRFPAASRALADRGKLWIIWPKKTSDVASDLTQSAVRGFGLGSGFVDYKISAIDETWSGLCFARRRREATMQRTKRR
jgi:hypothetical protein